MKKIISLLVAAILLTLSVTSCGAGVPKVEEIKPRLTELIEASYEINDIFFGDGLDRVDYEAEYEKIIAEYAEGLAAAEKKLASAQEAVAKAANEEEKLAAEKKVEEAEKEVKKNTYMFTKEEFLAQYDTDATYTPVRSDKYVTVNDIKAAAEEVYSKAYLMSVYQTIFVGYVQSGISDIIYARYYEGNEGLMILKDPDVWVTAKRIYDYDSMKVVRPSNSKKITLLIDSHLEGETEILPVRLSFVKQDGEWYLDSPSY